MTETERVRYIKHRWLANDGDAADCYVCGISESDFCPDDGPMVSCHVPQMIDVGYQRHLSSSDAETQVAIRYGHDEISDACAATIASWWQAPSYPNSAFAALASGCAVDYDDLSRAIVAEYGDASPKDRKALDILGTWALAQVRGE